VDVADGVLRDLEPLLDAADDELRELLSVAGEDAVVVVVIDQGTKVWAEATLSEHERIPLIGDLLGLQLAYNPGAAFSFGESFNYST
jgi:signal peptidase II